MPGTMSQADLVEDLKSALHDAADIFLAASDGDFKRLLDLAAADLGRFRLRTLVGSLLLQADKYNYLAPADLIRPKFPMWGVAEKRNIKPYARNWPGRLPQLLLVEAAGGVRELHLDPPPTQAQIVQFGASYRYYYFAAHKIAAVAAETSVQPYDRDLLLLRASAEAMREMAVRNSKKPVNLRDGMMNAPRNQTPAALADWLMEEFERRAA